MPINQYPTSDLVTDNGYRSSFSHNSENDTSPGFYTVFLDDPQILVELTATTHVGLHRYTWTQDSAMQYILFDISHTVTEEACANASIYIDVKNGEISGSVLNMGALSSRVGTIENNRSLHCTSPLTSNQRRGIPCVYLTSVDLVLILSRQTGFIRSFLFFFLFIVLGGSWNYFVARFDHPIVDFGVWDSNKSILTSPSDSYRLHTFWAVTLLRVDAGVEDL